ncbi:MAG: site-2 protease family protein [Clostridia bacterium]|nr:site-2 protease family protein [Clostridia bacterium]
MSWLFTLDGLKDLLLWIPVILFSISFHECAHAWMANRLGDPTAKDEGRLTLNPIKHLNLIGFLMMVIVHFGWATPVSVNPNNFKNPSKGMLYTAVAGPVSNVLLAIVSSFLYVSVSALAYYLPVNELVYEMFNYLALMLLYMLMLNIGLAVFNLLPVYPLDGSRVLSYFLPVKYNNFMVRYGQYIQIAFILIVFATPFVDRIISTVQDNVANFFISFWLSLFKLVNLL